MPFSMFLITNSVYNKTQKGIFMGKPIPTFFFKTTKKMLAELNTH